MKFCSSRKSKKLVGILFLVIAIAVFPLIDKNTYHQLILGEAIVNLIVVLGLNFITGLTGQMNLGTAGIMALGAYTSVLLRLKLNVPVLVTLLASIGIGYLIGILLGYPSLRLKGVYLSLTTIGFSEIVRLVIANWVDLTNGTNGIKDIPDINLFGIKLDNVAMIIWFYLIIAIFLTYTAYRLVNSRWGRVFKGIRDNSDSVEASGVDIADLKIKAFTLASIYNAIGGWMYAYLVGYINPSQFTQDISANYLLMMMFGGIGNVGGSIIGAFTITILPEALRFLQDYYWLVFGIITLFFAIFFPYGVVSIFRKDGIIGKHFSSKLKFGQEANHV